MLKASVAIKADKALRNLRLIHTKDIPAAKAAAFNRAGQKVGTEVSTYLYNTLGVQKWQVGGYKGRGGRIGRTKYIRKMDGIRIYFRHRDINPTGTKHRAANVSEGSGGRVKASGRTYEKARKRPGKYGQGYIYLRGREEGKRVASIDINQAHISNFRRITKSIGPNVFADRFEHEFNRRLRRRGS